MPALLEPPAGAGASQILICSNRSLPSVHLSDVLIVLSFHTIVARTRLAASFDCAACSAPGPLWQLWTGLVMHKAVAQTDGQRSVAGSDTCIRVLTIGPQQEPSVAHA